MDLNIFNDPGIKKKEQAYERARNENKRERERETGSPGELPSRAYSADLIVIDDDPTYLKTLKKEAEKEKYKKLLNLDTYLFDDENNDKEKLLAFINGKVNELNREKRSLDAILVDRGLLKSDNPEREGDFGNGIEVIEALRKNEATRYVPILLLSAYLKKVSSEPEEDDNFEEINRIDAQGFLYKFNREVSSHVGYLLFNFLLREPDLRDWRNEKAWGDLIQQTIQRFNEGKKFHDVCNEIYRFLARHLVGSPCTLIRTKEEDDYRTINELDEEKHPRFRKLPEKWTIAKLPRFVNEAFYKKEALLFNFNPKKREQNDGSGVISESLKQYQPEERKLIEDQQVIIAPMRFQETEDFGWISIYRSYQARPFTEKEVAHLNTLAALLSLYLSKEKAQSTQTENLSRQLTFFRFLTERLNDYVFEENRDDLNAVGIFEKKILKSYDDFLNKKEEESMKGDRSSLVEILCHYIKRAFHPVEEKEGEPKPRVSIRFVDFPKYVLNTADYVGYDPDSEYLKPKDLKGWTKDKLKDELDNKHINVRACVDLVLQTKEKNEDGILSLMCAPIYSEQTVLGTLTVAVEKEKAYDKHLEVRLQSIADWLGHLITDLDTKVFLKKALRLFNSYTDFEADNLENFVDRAFKMIHHFTGFTESILLYPEANATEEQLRSIKHWQIDSYFDFQGNRGQYREQLQRWQNHLLKEPENGSQASLIQRYLREKITFKLHGEESFISQEEAMEIDTQKQGVYVHRDDEGKPQLIISYHFQHPEPLTRFQQKCFELFSDFMGKLVGMGTTFGAVFENPTHELQMAVYGKMFQQARHSIVNQMAPIGNEIEYIKREHPALTHQFETMQVQLENIRLLMDKTKWLSHKATFKEVPVASIQKQMNDEFARQLEKRGIDFKWEGDPETMIYTDQDYFLKILEHLIGNASTHVVPEGWIGVEVKSENSRFEFRVVNPLAAEHPSLSLGNETEKFFKAGFTQTPEGSGFGLYACRTYARLLGAELNCTIDLSTSTIAFVLSNLNEP